MVDPVMEMPVKPEWNTKTSIDKGVILSGQYAMGCYKGELHLPTTAWETNRQRGKLETAPRRRLDGITVSLTGVWTNNYFHWITESLTQLLCLDMDKIDRIIVPNTARFIMDSLEMVGYKGQVMKWDGVPTSVDLYSCGPQRVWGWSHPLGFALLREHFAMEGKGPEKIFLSRRYIGKRRILNEDKMVEALYPDYKVIAPEKHSLREQIELFSNAKEIASPHGSCLTNILWARNASVTEYFGSYHHWAFLKLARECGHTYNYVNLKPKDEDMLWCPV